ncbi:MAG: hypothetical protein ABIH41_01825 [Nanoarchaeota archaeon]
MPYSELHADPIHETIERLHVRIRSRFPDSGLSKVCAELLSVSANTKKSMDYIRKPQWPLRIATSVVVVLLVALSLIFVGVFVYYLISLPQRDVDYSNLLQGAEADISTLVFLSAGLYFLVRLEDRRKRGKALRHLHALRSLAHVVDMHQLTKDPDHLISNAESLPNSQARKMTQFELVRYLDYCSEMLSLIGKLAAMTSKGMDDEVVLEAANNVEDLASNLSRKIWQKIMVSHIQKKR